MSLTDLPNNPMNFTENQHGNVVLDKLKLQKEQGRFCDVTLYVKDRQFRAHRNILASCSPYFDSILKTHRTVKERLTITCQNSDIFQCLLNYMYTGSIVIDKHNVSELLRLANHFLVMKLKGYCGEYLDRYLDVTNCLTVRDMAEKYNLPVLSKAATMFVQIHLNKIIHGDELLGLPLHKIESFLSSKCWSIPQQLVLSVVARWISRDVASRERNMRCLLSFVNWNALDGSVISEHVDREPLYSNSETCLYVVLQTLVENNLLFPKYQGIYQALQDKFSQIGFPPNSFPSPINDGIHNAVTPEEFVNHGTNDKCDGLNDRRNEKTPEKCENYKPSKLVFRRTRRTKKKLSLMRPRARLAAMKAALSARQNKMAASQTDSQNQDTNGGAAPLRCHLCPHAAPDAARLEQHAASAHAREVSYKCGVCGFVCRWNGDYHAHVSTHFRGPPFKCDSCDYTCDRLSLVLTHRTKHSNEKPHRCPECGYRCRTRHNLAVHSRCHAADRPHKCEVCGRSFPSKTQLDQHSVSHGSERPYLCDICGFSTRYLSHLVAHKRIHTGDVYRCSYPQCKYSTPKKSQLGSHSRTHATVRPHSCNTCGRGFLEKSHLVRHERIHLQEKPFKCSECEYASSRRDKLKEHFGRHHGEHASAKVPYKARPVRAGGKKNCQENHSTLTDRTNHGVQPSELELMVPPHHPPPPSVSYPGFPEHHLDFHHPHHHHPQLRPPPPVTTKSDHHLGAQNQNPPVFSGTPRMNNHHHQSPAAAVAAMMLDPRFHHPNPNTGTYHPMVAPPQGANQNQPIGGQHQEYPCMPLF